MTAFVAEKQGHFFFNFFNFFSNFFLLIFSQNTLTRTFESDARGDRKLFFLP